MQRIDTSVDKVQALVCSGQRSGVWKMAEKLNMNRYIYSVAKLTEWSSQAIKSFLDHSLTTHMVYGVCKMLLIWPA